MEIFFIYEKEICGSLHLWQVQLAEYMSHRSALDKTTQGKAPKGIYQKHRLLHLLGDGRSRGAAQRMRSELSAIDNVLLGTTGSAGPRQGARGIHAHIRSHLSFMVSHP